MLTWPGKDGPDLIVDDGGDATMLIHEGRKAEEKYAKDGSLPDPASTTNAEFKCVLALIRESIKKDPKKWTNYIYLSVIVFDAHALTTKLFDVNRHQSRA